MEQDNIIEKKFNLIYVFGVLVIILVLVTILSVMFFNNQSNIVEDNSLNKNDFVEVVPRTPEQIENTKCNQIDDWADRGECLLNLKDCEVLGDGCYADKALFYQNEEICSEIINESILDECINSIKETQILVDVMINDDIELCSNFGSNEKIQFCRDNYYNVKRFNEGDKKYCEFINNETVRAECEK